jgi:competence protein ComEA
VTESEGHPRKNVPPEAAIASIASKKNSNETKRSFLMTLRPIVRALIVPVLGLSLSGIPSHPALAEGEAAAQPTVNVNQASATELARLPRVGPKLADKILTHRKEHGPFKRIEDLMEVKGVGEKMFALLKPYVAVSGATTLADKVTSRSKGRSTKSAEKKAPEPPAKS